MSNPSENFTIKQLHISEFEKLSNFFIKAYGSETIFQNEDYFNYYFKQENGTFKYNLIALNDQGEIISHYGGLDTPFILNNEIVSITWGVNAYTLPEYRGKGLNSQIVDFINNNFDINCVIGFTPKTASFYESIHYNIFNKARFSRHIYLLNHELSKSVSELLHEDNQQLFATHFANAAHKQQAHPNVPEHIVVITEENFDQYDYSIGDQVNDVNTTYRSKSYIKWRFIDNPITYKVFGFKNDQNITSYIVIRKEHLLQVNAYSYRIIDLYGAENELQELLLHTINDGLNNEIIYIDFSKFGALYHNLLQEVGFVCLEDDAYALFPQVTSPMEYRPNLEYVGFNSVAYKNQIQLLSKDNIYLTRMDSDRDRLAKTTQLQTK